MDHGYLPPSERSGYYVSYVADMFRTARFGVTEAHGMAEMMEFNYLSEKGALQRDLANGKYTVDYSRMAPSINDLLKELLEQEASGDRARAEAWFAKYDVVAPELKGLLDKQNDIPVDIAPEFSFPFKLANEFRH